MVEFLEFAEFGELTEFAELRCSKLYKTNQLH